MKIEKNGIVYELDYKTKTAKVVEYRAANIDEQVIPHCIHSYIAHCTVTEIGDGAFKYSDIRKVVLPLTLTKIGECAFMASKLSYIFREETTMPVPLTIGDSAFVNCTNLVKVELHGKINLIGDNHFVNCYQLDEIDSCNIRGRIGQWSFAQCSNLDDFYLADDVIVEKTSFENTKFNQVFIGKNVRISGGIKHTLNTMNILCHDDSDILDLAYEGYNIRIIGKTS